MTTDEEQIRDLVATWLAASKRGDTAQVLTLMSADVVFLTPGQPPMDKAGFIASQAGLSGYDLDAESTIREIRVLNEAWAYCWTRLTVTITARDGSSSMRREGDTLSILNRQAGQWVIVRDANMLAPVQN